jgi:branched-chain amino acid transport system ATP-binding protein
MSLLEVSHLTVRYGRVTAVKDVSFGVAPGAVLAVLGRNGAGKSSLLAAIVGAVRPAEGRVLWEGRDVTRRPPDRKARDGVVMIPEGRRVFPRLTVRENLVLGGFGLDRDERERALHRVGDLFPVLRERAGALAGLLSGGQQQMLALARALMGSPRLLLLDEPSLGLAPKVIDEVYRQLGALRGQGITIVLVEQHVSRALEFADRALVLNLGEVVLEDDPAALVDDPRLVAAYMGERPR